MSQYLVQTLQVVRRSMPRMAPILMGIIILTGDLLQLEKPPKAKLEVELNLEEDLRLAAKHIVVVLCTVTFLSLGVFLLIKNNSNPTFNSKNYVAVVGDKVGVKREDYQKELEYRK